MAGAQAGGRFSRRGFLALSGAAAGLVHTHGRALAQGAQQVRDPLTSATLRDASERLRRKQVSSLELTDACLRRIDRYQPQLNAFITVTHDLARDQARAADAEIASGRWRGPLHGVPLALKDNIDTEGIRTTAASLVFSDRIPADDAEVVRRLKHAGAVIVGKTNLLVFAGSTISTYFKPVRNPWALDRSPSGSSSGSAVAVACELCYGALGTDTRGSIRGPAGVCGIVGLKPTNGRVSNRGVIPLAWTLDTVGAMCRTVEDVAILLQGIAGYDADDPSSAPEPVPDYIGEHKASVKALRIGVPTVPFSDKGDLDLAAVVDEALPVLAGLTKGVRRVELPAVGGLAQLMNAETYAYHSEWYPKYADAYPLPFRRALEKARAISSADYATARREIDRLRRTIGKVFEDVDVLVTPGRRSYPGKIDDILKAQAADPPAPPEPELSFTQQFSVFGLPALNLPCGFTKAGLPVSVQVVGPHWGESRVLALSHAYQQVTDWHTHRPPLPDTSAAR